jgi:hypothetical protein
MSAMRREKGCLKSLTLHPIFVVRSAMIAYFIAIYATILGAKTL